MNQAHLTRESQNDAILSYLQSGNRLTPLDSLRLFGSFRLSGRVYDARQKGHNIKSRIIETENGKRVAQYWIDPAEPLIPMSARKKEKVVTISKLKELAREIAGDDLITGLAYSKLIVAVEMK